jgi:hypothetical protein
MKSSSYRINNCKRNKNAQEQRIKRNEEINYHGKNASHKLSFGQYRNDNILSNKSSPTSSPNEDDIPNFQRMTNSTTAKVKSLNRRRIPGVLPSEDNMKSKRRTAFGHVI